MPRFECTKCGSLVVAEKGAENALCAICGKMHHIPADANEDGYVITIHSYDPKWNHYEKLVYQARTYRDIQILTKTAEEFDSLKDYEDSPQMAEFCRKRIAEEQCKRQEEANTRAIRERHQAKGDRKRLLMYISSVAAVILLIILWNVCVIPYRDYKEAELLIDEGHYADAIDAFEKLDGFYDSVDRIAECEAYIIERNYQNAVALMNKGTYASAKMSFERLNGYKDSAALAIECSYHDAVNKLNNKEFWWAMQAFQKLGDYKDSEDLYLVSQAGYQEESYTAAVTAMNEKNYVTALRYFDRITGYRDSNVLAAECRYQKAISYMNAEKYKLALHEFEKIPDYKDVSELVKIVNENLSPAE